MMMTLECIVRAVPKGAVERSGAGARWGGDGVEGRKVVAAARVRPKLERRGGRAKRRKVEENRLKAGRDMVLIG